MKCPECGKRFYIIRGRCECGHIFPHDTEKRWRQKRALSALRWGSGEFLFGLFSASLCTARRYPDYLLILSLIIMVFGIFNLGFGLVEVVKVRIKRDGSAE